MNVVSLTLCYPCDRTPHAGLFIRERLGALHATTDPPTGVRVVHPLPIPAWSRARGWRRSIEPVPVRPPRFTDGITPDEAPPQLPPCWHPPMPYVPLVGKPLNPCAYARAVLPLVATWSRRHEVDVIDAHFSWPDGVAAAIVARALRLPYTVTLRGVLHRYARPGPVGCLAYPWFRVPTARALRGAAAVIAVSGSLKSQAVRLGVDARKIHVIPNGIDRNLFKPGDRLAARRAVGRSPDDILLITVGHLCRRKGFHRVLSLLPPLLRHPSAAPWAARLRYVIVGADGAEGRFATRLRRLARRLGVADRVTFTGSLEPARVATWLQAADLFVLPTTNEGWCNALSEAVATRLPVVCTDVGGNRDQVPRGAGRVVPPTDRRALFHAILDMLQAIQSVQTARPRTMSPAGPVGTDRSWSRVARETAAVLHGVLSSHTASRPNQSSRS